MAEKEYIEREAIINKINELLSEYEDCDGIFLPKHLIPSGLCKALIFIKTQSTADVQEVRHGKWETPTKPFPYYDWKCSICGCEEYSQVDHNGKYREMNYCPHCGAKMDKN